MRTALLAAIGLFVSSTALAGHGHARGHARPAPRQAPTPVVYVAPAPVYVTPAPAARPGYVWIADHWEGRVWVPGHWQAVAPPAPPPPHIGVSVGIGGVHVAVNAPL